MPVGCAKLLKVSTTTPKRVAMGGPGVTADTYRNYTRRLRAGVWETESTEVSPFYETDDSQLSSVYDYGFAGVAIKKTIFFLSLSALRETRFSLPNSTYRIGKRSTDGGATWSDVTETNFVPEDFDGAESSAAVWSSLARRPSDNLLVTCGATHSTGFNFAGYARLMYSTDKGASWQQATSIATAPSLPNDGTTYISNVIYAKTLGKFFGVGGPTTTQEPAATAVYESTDGISWIINHYIARISGSPNNAFGLKGVGCSGNTLIAWGFERHSNTNYKFAIRSTDGGATWVDMGLRSQGLQGAGNDFAKVVTNGKGVWVAADSGVMFPWVFTPAGRSMVHASVDDGVTWQQVFSHTNGICGDLVFADGKFWLARGAYMDAPSTMQGTIMTSVDGLSWSTSQLFDSQNRPHAFAI